MESLRKAYMLRGHVAQQAHTALVEVISPDLLCNINDTQCQMARFFEHPLLLREACLVEEQIGDAIAVAHLFDERYGLLHVFLRASIVTLDTRKLCQCF